MSKTITLPLEEYEALVNNFNTIKKALDDRETIKVVYIHGALIYYILPEDSKSKMIADLEDKLNKVKQELKQTFIDVAKASRRKWYHIF